MKLRSIVLCVIITATLSLHSVTPFQMFVRRTRDYIAALYANFKQQAKVETPQEKPTPTPAATEVPQLPEEDASTSSAEPATEETIEAPVATTPVETEQPRQEEDIKPLALKPQVAIAPTSSSSKERLKTLDIPPYNQWVAELLNLVPFWEGKKYPAAAPSLTKERILTILSDATRFAPMHFGRWYYGSEPAKLLPPDEMNLFIERKILNPGDTVYFIGDIHGDARSIGYLLEYLREKKLIDPSTYKLTSETTHIVFLGDYSDRQLYGFEVLCTLAQLRQANPNQVFLLRGNHEGALNEQYGLLEAKFDDIAGAEERMDADRAGKIAEISKYPGSIPEDFKPTLYAFYNTLPSALFIGAKDVYTKKIEYILACHGGPEPGAHITGFLEAQDPAQFYLITSLNYEYSLGIDPDLRRLTLDSRDTFKITSMSGFNWSDFEPADYLLNAYNKRTKRRSYSKKSTEKYLHSLDTKNSSVNAIFRGHQHGDKRLNKFIFQSVPFITKELAENIGVGRLWLTIQPNPKEIPLYSVTTFMTAPESIYGKKYNYPYLYMGKVTIGDSFDKWQFKVIKILNREFDKYLETLDDESELKEFVDLAANIGGKKGVD